MLGVHISWVVLVTIYTLESRVRGRNVVALQARQPDMGTGGNWEIQCVMIPRGWCPTVGCMARLARIGKGCR